MGPEDLRLKRAVEAMLVRHYVNTQKADVDVISGNVYLDGEFHVMGGQVEKRESSDEPIEGHYEARRVLLALEREIRSMGEVNGLFFNFKNWTKSGTGWAPK